MAKCLGFAPYSLSKIMMERDKLEGESKYESQCKKMKNLKTKANKTLRKSWYHHSGFGK
jgi:hypothetical protein